MDTMIYCRLVNVVRSVRLYCKTCRERRLHVYFEENRIVAVVCVVCYGHYVQNLLDNAGLSTDELSRV